MRPKAFDRLGACGFLTAVLALLAGCGNTFAPLFGDERYLAPFVASPEMVAEEMLRMAAVSPDDVVYDLGSGDGRIVILAARKWGAKGVGFDLDADLVRRATENARRAGVGHLVEFREQDVLTVDLSPATVVTIYLSRSANLKLRPAIRSQLRPGARVVSHEFDMGDWRPDAVREILDETGIPRTLLLWRIGQSKP